MMKSAILERKACLLFLLLSSAWLAIFVLVPVLKGFTISGIQIAVEVTALIVLALYGFFVPHIKYFLIWFLLLLLGVDMFFVWIIHSKDLGLRWLISGLIGFLIGLVIARPKRTLP